MEKHSFLWILLLTFSFSCGTNDKFSKDETTTQDEAWAQMMEGHDVVMPLMGDIYQISKELKKLAEDSMVEASDFHPRVQQTLVDLEAAEDGMMEWMARISENPLSAVRERSSSHQEVLEFIEEEDQVIQAVAKEMTSSIQRGKELIKERQGQ
jgi:hypothetical protein